MRDSLKDEADYDFIRGYWFVLSTLLCFSSEARAEDEILVRIKTNTKLRNKYYISFIGTGSNPVNTTH